MSNTAVLVKVCGMRRVEDAVLAAELGASAVGFIFWPGSPRFIDASNARTIAAAVPPAVIRVGVFVDQAPEFVKEVAERVPLDAVQLHGDESSEDYADLGVPLIKAIAVSDPFDAAVIDAVPEDVTVLLDAHDPVRRGGTGRTIDWSVAAAMAARRRTILSGGLHPHNVAEAVDGSARTWSTCRQEWSRRPASRTRRSSGRFSGHSRPTGSGPVIPIATDHASIIRPARPRRARLLRRLRRPVRAGDAGGADRGAAPAPTSRRERRALPRELAQLLRDYVGRPTPLYEARRLSESLGGARIFLKREDLAHTGAHKINNALGQALLAERMGKRRIIAETGAGQHGVATATVCALLGLECVRLHGRGGHGAAGAQRLPHAAARREGAAASTPAARTLKDAINEAMRDWVTNVADTLLPARVGARAASVSADGARVPVGDRPGGARADASSSSAGCPTRSSRASAAAATPSGIFDAFIDDRGVRLIGVEAGGDGIAPGEHAARFAGGSAGVLQGTRSYVLQDDDGNIELTHSISAGLDYAAVGPEHAWLRDIGRAEYTWIDDAEALDGVPAAGARARASCRRSSRRTRSRTRAGSRRRWRSDGDPAREPVGPRRQGRAAASRRRSAQRGGSTLMSTDSPTHSTAARRAARRPRDLRHRRRSGPGARRREILRGAGRGGADVLEVGVPFSDPLADGPVIQRATERALARRHDAARRARSGARRCARRSTRRSCSSATPTRCCAWVPTAFARAARRRRRRRRAGRSICRSKRPSRCAAPLVDAGLDTIFLLSPTTTDERIRRSAELGRGFLYVISRLGVTGARDQVAGDARGAGGARSGRSRRCRRARVRHLAARARRARSAAAADAAVVGSALVNVIAEHGAVARRRRTGRASMCAG